MKSHPLNLHVLPGLAAGTAAALLSAGAPAAPAKKAPLPESAAPAIDRRKLSVPGESLKPFMLARPGGGAYLAWAQKEGERTRIYFAASRDGVSYGPTVPVSAEGMDLDLGAESGPQAAVGPDGAIYVVWNSGSWSVPSSGHGGSRGSTPGKGGPPPRPGNLNVYLSCSRNGGKSFSRPVKVNDDREGAEHRFPTVATDARGTVYVVWLDKRKQTPERPDFSRVFFARSADQGRTFSPNVDATSGQETGICHCCKLALLVRPGGELFIAYRNDVHDMRDIFLIRSADGGATFEAPRPIEEIRWMIPACPFNGPSLGLDDGNRLHAVWLTGGAVTGAPAIGKRSGDPYKVLYRQRDPGAGSWGDLLFLAEGARPRMAVQPDGTAYVSWENEGIQVARISGKGGPSPGSFRLTAPEASAAFSSLALDGSGALLAAWQQRGADDRWQVWTARVTVDMGKPSRVSRLPQRHPEASTR